MESLPPFASHTEVRPSGIHISHHRKHPDLRRHENLPLDLILSFVLLVGLSTELLSKGK